jgi:hypothetical protein
VSRTFVAQHEHCACQELVLKLRNLWSILCTCMVKIFRYLPWTCLGRLTKNSVPSLHCTHFSMEQTYNLRWRRIWTCSYSVIAQWMKLGKIVTKETGRDAFTLRTLSETFKRKYSLSNKVRITKHVLIIHCEPDVGQGRTDDVEFNCFVVYWI